MTAAYLKSLKYYNTFLIPGSSCFYLTGAEVIISGMRCSKAVDQKHAGTQHFQSWLKEYKSLFLPQKTKLGAKKVCYYCSQKRVFPRKQMSAFLKILSQRRTHFFFFQKPALEAAYIFMLLSLLPALNDESDVCVLLASLSL